MLVCESLFEFKKGLDPVESLGMGRRKLIKDWLDLMDVQSYIINDDYTIDSEYVVSLSFNNLYELPDFIQFGVIKNNFFIHQNNLTSLRGCPVYVGRNFWCDSNNLTSLEGVPKIVTGNFECHNNKIKFTKKDIQKVCKVGGSIYV